MKRIFRMLVFSAIAIYLTSLWNKGFLIESEFLVYLKASIMVAAVFYLIGPVSKIVLLPLNIVTLGLISVAFYALIFYFLMDKFSLIKIIGWNFPGTSFYGIIIIPFAISQLTNVVIASISVSAMIGLLEKIL